MEEKYIVINGVNTHYYEAGEGDHCIFLLHGGGLDNAELSWGLIIPILSKDNRVIALDWPGYGKSDTPDEKFVVPYYVQFFEAFVNQFKGIKQVDLVGISMGGAIALGYTLNCPENVHKLVLVDSYGLQRKAPFHKLSYLFIKMPGMRPLTWWMMKQRWMIKYSLGSILKRPGSITDELVDAVLAQAQSPGANKAFGDMQDGDISWSGIKTNYLDRLQEIQQKTLVIHGSKDTLVPLAASEEAAKLIPNATLSLLDGCGHWPQRDDPAGFEKLVVTFLDD